MIKLLGRLLITNIFLFIKAEPTGLEPAISTVTVWHPGPAERQHQISIVLDVDQHQSTINKT